MVDADKPQPKPRAAVRRKPEAKVSTADRVRQAYAANPDATRIQLATIAGTTDRTVRRVLNAANPDNTADSPADGETA